MNKIVLATGNSHKMKDYIEIAKEFSLDLLPQTELKIPDAEENGVTFVENALIKAHNASQFTNLPVLAEDSGLIIDALQGAPGLYSARYAGEKATQQQNIDKVLKELDKIPNANRQARLYVVAVLLRYPKDPAPIIAEGIIRGEILNQPVGNNPFGYLPIFYLPEMGCTAGELSLVDKNKISHRGQAARILFQRFILEKRKL